MDYELVDPDKVKAEYRKSQAQEWERQAIYAEIDAAQWEAVAEADAAAKLTAQGMAATAQERRDRANELHDLAGTDPEDFEETIRNEVRQRLASMEIQHAQLQDQIDHPDAYRLGSEWQPPVIELRVVELGIEAIRKRFPDVDADGVRVSVSQTGPAIPTGGNG